jgi:predicted ATP-grasp superfamily ATP-dependent carboligase
VPQDKLNDSTADFSKQIRKINQELEKESSVKEEVTPRSKAL